ncbi:DUF397 domain-containing protein [Actinomadura sp. LOL_016]|uniref:DUF397 domain-containing protein n=1 Tax=unclassified Actinomadura TaxID=2626254 RepID=UPI003A7FF71A
MSREAFTSWRKSSYSGSDKDCVEVGRHSGHVGVADTKHQGVGPILIFDPAEWAAFTTRAKTGTYDLNRSM